MDEKLTQLKEKIDDIEGLKKREEWGPEFQLWKRSTEKLVLDIFGDDGFKIFKDQGTISFSYIDDGFNRRQYLEELENRKKILDGLLAELKEHQPSSVGDQSPKNILREVWNKEDALRANLLTTQEAQVIQSLLISHLEKEVSSSSIPGLKLRKMRAEKSLEQWWSDKNGYPTDNAWKKIEPFLEIYQQYEAEKTIKNRFVAEGLFVETRSRDEDVHLLIGKKDGDAGKAHLILDGKTGEIRVEDNQQEPTSLVSKVEAVLTLPNGKKIRTTREAIEEIE